MLDLWGRDARTRAHGRRALGRRARGHRALFTMRLAMPGGVVPMAGVTAVGVDPVHRRRGLLDRMMRAHLATIHERGEEALSGAVGVGGRHLRALGLRPGDARRRSHRALARRAAPRPRPAGRPRAGEPASCWRRCVRSTRRSARAAGRWSCATTCCGRTLLADFEHLREGFGRLRGLVTDDGYALYSVKEHAVDGPARVRRAHPRAAGREHRPPTRCCGSTCSGCR